MSLPAHMKGQAEFFPHGYINSWASHLIDDLKFIEQGQGNYCRISSLLAILSFEAYLNYVGDRLITPWPERNPWKNKLTLLLDTYNASAALASQPFILLDALFDYRNKFAHGRITVNPLDYTDYGGGNVVGEHRGEPQWYKDFGRKEQAEKTLEIVRECMLAIHKLAEPNDPRSPWEILGSGSASQVS